MKTEFLRKLNRLTTVAGIVAVLAGNCFIASATRAADIPTSLDSATANASWYQVEVVIFTQQGYSGNERSPTQYHLNFPEQTVELIDPQQLSANAPSSADNSSLATVPARQIPWVDTADPLLGIASSKEGTSSGEILTATPATHSIVALPDYETPFVKLPASVRNLNESAATLDRRGQSQVIFHEAWRFAADENSNDPWVVIKAGRSFQDRYQLEGSLRFYKSRFLHFQSNLWLVDYANSDERSSMIELPDFPNTQNNPRAGYRTSEITFNPDKLDNFYIDLPSSLGEPALQMDVSSEIAEEKAKRYPVSSLWLFDQSKRIEETQSYYLDHPKMGIFVTIKPHQPERQKPHHKQMAEMEVSSETSVN